MKNLDYNEIKIFINLEIIGEEKLYLFFFNLKIFLQFLHENDQTKNLDCNQIMILSI